jgi:hypothetical protein
VSDASTMRTDLAVPVPFSQRVRRRGRVRNLLRRQRTRANRLLRLPPDRDTARRRVRHPDPLSAFSMWGLLTTYAEEDVIEATVRNAFAQGCERVLLVDNGSPDRTVERALGAGADLLEVYDTAAFDEFERTERNNATIASLTQEAPEPWVWWLQLDADEFPEGPDGRTVRAFLEGLDRSVRTVGARFVNHFPTPGAAPAYVPGFLPLDFQPLSEQEPFSYCWQRHYKHPLVRQDRGSPPIFLRPGSHSLLRQGGRRIVEASGGIVVHHHQFRAEEDTRRRMALVASRLNRNELVAQRMRHLDDVYAGNWDAVRLYRGRLGDRGVRPTPWDEPTDHIPRWYSDAELQAARRRGHG